MKTRSCCQMKSKLKDGASPAPTLRSQSRWRRGGEIAGWIIPSATLVLMPKCPACVAGYVALFSGVGISLTNASVIRTALLILCFATLLGLALKRLQRLASARSRMPVVHLEKRAPRLIG